MEAGPRTKSSAGFRLQTPGYRKTRGCGIMKPEARSLKPGPGDFAGTLVMEVVDHEESYSTPIA